MDGATFSKLSFTHIVIGGGTAGLTVAARLSENTSLKVGVLEAGPSAFDDPRIKIPGRLGESLGTECDWNFKSLPQKELNGRTIPVPRGKVLGGSSALNFMMWARGAKDDYDAWEELGCEGWGWDGILPYLKKPEHFYPPHDASQAAQEAYYEAPFHGTDGPLQTTYSKDYGAHHPAWIEALKSLGIPTNHSHFSGNTLGAWTSLGSVTHEQRERAYSATAYYQPNSGRQNLVLLTEALAQEIVLKQPDGGDWVATGVRFTHGGKEYTANAGASVVLCAGALQSPQLLELSGIGNPEILSAAGIETKLNSPNVGEHLQDHAMTMMIYEIDPSIPTADDLRSDAALHKNANDEYQQTRSGLLATCPWSPVYLPFSHFLPASTLSSHAASIRANLPNPPSPRHKILLRRLESASKDVAQLEYLLALSNYNTLFPSAPDTKYATLFQILQSPFSSGSVHIRPTSSGQKPPTAIDPPLIDPKCYEGPGGAVDFALMVAAEEFGDRLCSTPPLDRIIGKRVYPPQPAAGQSATEAMEQWVRASTSHDYHPVGTCAMGRSGEGVVDERLRVYGVKGLRVVDASIMPLLVSAHPQGTIYGIGEKGASLLLEDWEAGIR